ncbi:MAG: hypothetical protein R3E48_23160 [Burkholderiaceae bacterium]
MTLYAAISAGQRTSGQEHWLPLFHEHLETLFDYVGEAMVTFDHRADEAVRRRFEQITEHYQARVEGLRPRPSAQRPTCRCRRTACVRRRAMNGNA